MQNYSAFSYKAGYSFFHKIPAFVKLIFIPLFNILIFSFDFRFACVFIILQFLLFFFLKFTIYEQIKDLTPVIWYAVFMYLINVFSFIFVGFKEFPILENFVRSIKKAFLDEKTFALVVKFFACNQSASLMFKTSTSLEIKEGIETLEIFVRKFLPVKKEAKFALSVSMFINFIPAVFKIWGLLKKAWFARGGKTGIKMYLSLFPLWFSVGLKYALDSAKAISIRQKS
ncbi:hypothetical protein [Treponema pectinovorum]|uniref:hypothetical protein n=1 Tax=Treponema pectinovorum TaxID=164 RepID=UPI0011CB7FE4|nr:hypothetical protein [Treponema pectinovorum]